MEEKKKRGRRKKMNEAPAEVKSGRKLFSKINDTLNLNLIISQAYILNMPKKNEKQKEKTEENTKKKRRGREGGEESNI